MTSNIFSQLGGPQGTKSFYQQLRAGNNDALDVESGHMVNEDEENWAHQFEEQDIDNADGLRLDDSRVTANSASQLDRNPGRFAQQVPSKKAHGTVSATRWLGNDDEADNDVPASLLVEPRETTPAKAAHSQRQMPKSHQSEPAKSRAQNQQGPWQRAQARQQLHDQPSPPSRRAGVAYNLGGIAAGSPREKALWRWINVSNLDVFMKDVYDYYRGSGFRCIICERVLYLARCAFTAVFLTFLTQCVNFANVPQSKSLPEVLVPQCTKKMSGSWNFGLWVFVFYFIWKAVQFIIDTRRLLLMRDFYLFLLEIPEQDMQTVSWQDVVARLMTLRDANPSTALNLTPSQRRWLQAHSKERLDAIDIAGRLMRKDNYLIALINKDVLDLTLPMPFLGRQTFFSETLQWWLYFTIIDFVFDHHGQVNQKFLKSGERGLLSRKLRERLRFAGLVNLLCTPFWVGRQVFINLLNYYNEYKKDSATLSDRRYTALARWKFREFNELPHFFQERINMSYPFASRYIDQFPKRMTEQVAKTVTFMAGAVVFVLAAASFLDPELFLGFEITPDKTALFYFGVFGSVWALARGLISEETSVFDPEFALKGVTDFTHYVPDHWEGRLHSADVKTEFSELYKLKVVILIEEIIGIFLASLVLIFSLPKRSEQIIDFFREFTIHVDGLGYVCSFSEFNFKQEQQGDARPDNSPTDVRDGYYGTKHGKMAASYYGFLENYVTNPRSGIPGAHIPPSMRQNFQQPPAWPGLNSPTLTADMQGLRAGRPDQHSQQHHAGRARGSHGQGSRPPRFNTSVTAPSPMASVLLDPHHQPSGAPARSTHWGRSRNPWGDSHAEQGIIEETSEYGSQWKAPGLRKGVSESSEMQESQAQLGESTWETGPNNVISRESSGAGETEPEAGVLGLIYQFQQAHRDSRM